MVKLVSSSASDFFFTGQTLEFFIQGSFDATAIRLKVDKTFVGFLSDFSDEAASGLAATQFVSVKVMLTLVIPFKGTILYIFSLSHSFSHKSILYHLPYQIHTRRVIGYYELLKLEKKNNNNIISTFY